MISRKVYNALPENLKIKLRKFKRKYFRIDRGLVPNKKKVDKTVIVLGMHRSGSSMVSEILSRLGVNMGKETLAPGKDNERGFFENKYFFELNRKILAKAGGNWVKIPSRKSILKLKKDKSLIKQMKNIFNSQKDKIFGWKDPRTTITFPLYEPFLKNPYIIICKRNQRAIARSLKKRNNFPINFSLKLTSKYLKRLKEYNLSKSYPVLKLDYENFFKDPKKEINKIKSFLNIKKEINLEVINKKFKHF